MGQVQGALQAAQQAATRAEQAAEAASQKAVSNAGGDREVTEQAAASSTGLLAGIAPHWGTNNPSIDT